MEAIEFIQGARDVIVALCAAVGACVAVYGLNTWRREHRDTIQYELSRRILRALYKVHEKIKTFRNSFMSVSEQFEALKNAGHTVEEIKENGLLSNKFDIDSAVYSMRWNSLREAFLELDVETLEAKVLWGDEVPEALKPIEDCVKKLQLTARRKQRADSGSTKLTPEKMEEMDSILYSDNIGDTSEDIFGKKIVDAIRAVEDLTKPHLHHFNIQYKKHGNKKIKE